METGSGAGGGYPGYTGPAFLLELIRTANNSLLLFHLGNKPPKAVAFSDLE